jgi:hypothetical protein
MEPVSQSISARADDVDVRFLSLMYPSFLLPLYFQGVKSATIKLVPETEATKVTVTHDQWPEDDPTYVSCCDGWPRILSRLKTLLRLGTHSSPIATKCAVGLGVPTSLESFAFRLATLPVPSWTSHIKEFL